MYGKKFKLIPFCTPTYSHMCYERCALWSLESWFRRVGRLPLDGFMIYYNKGFPVHIHRFQLLHKRNPWPRIPSLRWRKNQSHGHQQPTYPPKHFITSMATQKWHLMIPMSSRQTPLFVDSSRQPSEVRGRFHFSKGGEGMMSITNIDDDNDAPLGHVQATFTRLPIITGGSNMNEFILG